MNHTQKIFDDNWIKVPYIQLSMTLAVVRQNFEIINIIIKQTANNPLALKQALLHNQVVQRYNDSQRKLILDLMEKHNVKE